MSLDNEMDLSDIDESFNYIIDPETSKNVLLESAVGQQVLKNYIEAVQNGADSENIVSTKMYYETGELNEQTEQTEQNEGDNSQINNNSSVENIYNYAKNLDNTQYSGKELTVKIKGLHKKAPIKGNKVWIRRSNGGWQRAVISEVSLNDEETTQCSVYFRTASDKIASKKGLDIEDIVFY